MSWYEFNGGESIGQRGSEDGTIVRDEEHADGARITFERDGRIAPFAITCGIYGWMLHTRFFDSESEGLQEFENMQTELGKILAAIPLTSDPEVEAKSAAITRSIAKFVERFP